MKKSKHPIYFYILLITITVVIFLFFHYILTVGENVEKSVKDEQLNFVDDCPSTYLNLIPKLKNLKLKGSMYSKTRDPISAFSYDKNLEVIIYRLPIKANGSLANIIKEDFSSSNLPDYTEYWMFSSNHWSNNGNPPCLIEYKHGIPQTGVNIFFNILGSDTKVLDKNDSIATYYSDFKNFSIRFNQNDKVDFLGQIDQNSAVQIPLEIQFKKYKNSIYLLIFPNCIVQLLTLEQFQSSVHPLSLPQASRLWPHAW